MEMIKRAAIVFSVILSACSTVPKAPSTQQLRSADNYSPVTQYLNQYIPATMKKHKFVGLSVALVDDQGVVWSNGYGYADKANKVAVNSDTLFRAGSVSKMFTASAIMQLAENGVVDIDKPITTYLPEFNLKSRFGSIDGITLRNTLSHHSGIPSAIIDGMWANNTESFKTVTTRLNDYYAAYPPNTFFSYSNAGYSLAGHVIERSSGVAYSDYMQNSVLQALGMHSSNFALDIQDENMSKAYWYGKEVEELSLRDLPAGGLITNVLDLAQFIKMVNADGASTEQFLKPQSLKEMLTVQRYNTVYEPDSLNTIGWFSVPNVLDDKYEALGHDGQTLAHSASVLMVPELKLGVAILSNSPSLDGELGKIAANILKLAYPVKTKNDLDNIQKNKRQPIGGTASSFDGVFSSVGGLANVAKTSGGYDVRLAGQKLKLVPQSNGQHKLKVKVLGFIPVAPGPLKELNFEARDVNGQKAIFVDSPGARQLVATEVSTDDRSTIWDERIGDYELTNPIDTDIEMMRVIGASLGYSNKVYYLELKTARQKLKMPLKVINESEATLQGYGRGLGETIFATGNDTLQHSGLIFKLNK